ncbi:MAG TPA: MFS transporter [Natronosporangium sp.]
MLRPELLRVFAVSFGAMVGVALLMSVVPLYAASAGAGDAGAGLTTGVLMVTTVAAELATPRLMARFGFRLAIGAGLLLLGVPVLALIGSAHLAVILAVCAVRGLGFGVVVVVGSALVATTVPPERRGEGLGLYGVVMGLPTVLVLPLGVFLVEQIGYDPVFVIAAVAALAGLVVVPGLPGRRPEPAAAPVGVVAAIRDGRLLRPSLVFSACALAAGVVVTFLPLAVTGATAGLAALALLVQAVTSTFTRWWAGRYGDRRGPARLLIPSLLAAVAGVLLLVFTGHPVAVLAGMVLFGAGFGASQNASLALMFDRVASAGYGAVSALWNLAYDGAMAVGAAGYGVLAAQTGYPVAFALTGALMLVALVPAVRDARRDLHVR